MEAEAFDRLQNLPIPMIDIGGLSGVIGAQPLDSFFGDLDAAVRGLGPAT